MNISLDQFYEHFQNVAAESSLNEDEEVETFLKQFDDAKIENGNETSNIFSELDNKITIEEIKTAISKLKRCKSSGIDTIMNEYFIECQDILIEPLEMLFNVCHRLLLYSHKRPRSYLLNASSEHPK